MNADAAQRLSRIGLFVLAATLLISAALLHGRLLANLDFDGENSATEAESLYALRSVRQGQPLYHDFHVPPHVLTQYTPLFYFVPGVVARLLHTDDLGTFLVGRCYCYVLWVAIGLVIYGLGRQVGASRGGAALGALLWLAGSLATKWANSYRPDAAAVFFSLAAVWVYLRGRQWSNKAETLVLLVVAFFHKQSAVAALAAIIIEEWRGGGRSRALACLGGWATAVALGIVWAQAATRGLFVMNVFGSLARTWWPAQPLYFLSAIVAGAAAFTGGVLHCLKSPGKSRAELLKLYFVIAFLLAFLSSAKAGANVNYYLEPFALGCILTGLVLTDWSSVCARTRRDVWLRMAWLGVALGSAFGTLQPRLSLLPGWWRTELIEHQSVRRQQAAAWARVGDYLSNMREPILVEDPYLALRAGSVPFIMNTGNFGDMRRTGNFDASDIIYRIEEGKFAAIITSFPLENGRGSRNLPSEWIERARRKYRLSRYFEVTGVEFQDVYVFQPN
jgi:hypothetical protein